MDVVDNSDQKMLCYFIEEFMKTKKTKKKPFNIQKSTNPNQALS